MANTPEPAFPGQQFEEGTDWSRLAEMDPTIRQMLMTGMPMTRDNYVDVRYNGSPPEQNEEFEMGLPPALQNFQGVGLSELPQGPMPLPSGPMGQGTKAALQGKPLESQVEQPPHPAHAPTQNIPIGGTGGRSEGIPAWQPPAPPKQGG